MLVIHYRQEEQTMFSFGRKGLKPSDCSHHSKNLAKWPMVSACLATNVEHSEVALSLTLWGKLYLYLSIYKQRERARFPLLPTCIHPSHLWLCSGTGAKVRCAAGVKMRDAVRAVQWRQTELSTGWDIRYLVIVKVKYLTGYFSECNKSNHHQNDDKKQASSSIRYLLLLSN